ncbi:MAG: cupin [Rhodospirillaceae bacterium]|jgi:cupin fold WbuC family metalloprotein|nr:cupin [Rhodospirillaceae bacterium]|tara:strand:+ start:20016 stop:20537 length:522 start_codon:yes stop_codon:yes gene_type:complete
MPFDWIEESDCVFYSPESIFTLSRDMIEFLLLSARNNTRRQSRLCTHHSHKSLLHEMIIVHLKGNYIPPHKHVDKIESFHIIKGMLAVLVFSDDGNIMKTVMLNSKGECLYYRLSNNLYHMVVPLSEYVVFHEVTNGPFNKGDIIVPKWAPIDDNEKILEFQNNISNKVLNSM